MILRHNDWRSRMHDNLEVRRRLPFEWGENDCAIFAAKHIQAMLGDEYDWSGPFVGTYNSAIGALKTLKGLGFDDLLEFAKSKLALAPHPIFCQRGDIVAIQAEATGWGLGIVLDSHIGVLGPSGYGYILRSDPSIAAGFKVGYE